MKQSARFFMGVLAAAFMVAGATATPAMAQYKAKDEKAAPAAKRVGQIKELFENAKVRVLEYRLKPGLTEISVERADRVIYNVKGGTLERIYPDGKKEKVVL